MVYPISFYGYKISKEDEKVMKKMGKFLEKISGKCVHVHPTDVLTYNHEVELHSNGAVFGPKVKRFSTGKAKWQLPDIKELHTDGNPDLRLKAMAILQTIGEEIKDYKEEEPEKKQESYVERDGVKFGDIQDIKLTMKEAEHLKNIRNLLGGGKIVIKKGDITVEIE